MDETPVQKIHVKVLRVAQLADTRHFYCEIPSENWRRVIFSMPVAALPHSHTRALLSLIQPGDQVTFGFTVLDANEHGIRSVVMLHSVENKDVRPDPASYGADGTD